MIIQDQIYGEIAITDPLIEALINSRPLQRLKQICQDGAVHFIQPVFKATRFDHSVGAWYLSHRFDRPLAEQVACLLHDVPHTAFSHVVDFAMDDHNQEYHDRFLEQIIRQSEIPEICASFGLEIEKVLRKEDYYLLDNHTPELSFDRWDYFMRDAHTMGILPLKDVRLFIESAKIKDGQFYFDNLQVAGHLCLTSLMVCRLGYVSPTNHGAYNLLGRAIKVALEQSVLTTDDLFSTDEAVWHKLVSAGVPEIDGYLTRLQPGREFVYAPREEAEFYGRNKARYIDPLVLKDGDLVHTSDLVPGLALHPNV